MTRPDESEPRRAATYMMLTADLAVEISALGYHRSPERCKCHIIVRPWILHAVLTQHLYAARLRA